MTFAAKLDATIQRRNSLLCLGLDPNLEMLPASFQDQPSSVAALSRWLSWVVAETQSWVCAYKPTLGFYLALGAEGITLLQQILQQIPADIPVILDLKHSDLNTASVLAETLFEHWQVDAVTVNPYVGQEGVSPFLLYPDRAVFVVTHTSNPSAAAIQDHPRPDMSLSLQVVKESQSWGSVEQICLEVGTPDPMILQQVRTLAPERTILSRSIWADGVDLPAIFAAGLNSMGTGLILPVPQNWLTEPDLSQRVQQLRDKVNQFRQSLTPTASHCEVWTPDVAPLAHNPHQDLIVQLFDVGCILFGSYVQASGATFPYYIDLRRIISNPQLFHQVLKAYAKVIAPLSFDRIAGIPYGSLPTATGLSLKLNRPMIYPRKEVKAHGTRRLVEGHYEPGETVVVVDDILITGKSIREGIAKLETTGLQVVDVVVLIDHGGGVKEKLATAGYRPWSVFTLSEIAQTLYTTGRISAAEYEAIAQMHAAAEDF